LDQNEQVYPLPEPDDIPTIEIEDSGLKRGLKARHLIMMSVGGTIGTGLFVASGSTIAVAGPVGALLAYW
jgi:lysine-specific permease